MRRAQGRREQDQLSRLEHVAALQKAEVEDRTGIVNKWLGWPARCATESASGQWASKEQSKARPRERINREIGTNQSDFGVVLPSSALCRHPSLSIGSPPPDIMCHHAIRPTLPTLTKYCTKVPKFNPNLDVATSRNPVYQRSMGATRSRTYVPTHTYSYPNAI